VVLGRRPVRDRALPRPERFTLHRVYYDGKQMWAVGDGPSIYSNTVPGTAGTARTASPLPPLGNLDAGVGGSPAFYGVAGTSSEDVWAVGDSGLILHWNGAAWSTVRSNTTAKLTSVFATSTSSAWAAGVAEIPIVAETLIS
jgi:hypothetical protein